MPTNKFVNKTDVQKALQDKSWTVKIYSVHIWEQKLWVVHIWRLACIQAHAFLDSGNKELSPGWVKNLLFPFT